MTSYGSSLDAAAREAEDRQVDAYGLNPWCQHCDRPHSECWDEPVLCFECGERKCNGDCCCGDE